MVMELEESRSQWFTQKAIRCAQNSAARTTEEEEASEIEEGETAGYFNLEQENFCSCFCCYR